MCISLIPDAEVMHVVSEIISELPGLQDRHFRVWVNHTSLLSSVLTYCSIPEEKHSMVEKLLYKLMVMQVYLHSCPRVSVLFDSTQSVSIDSDKFKKELEEVIQLSPLAVSWSCLKL